MPLVPKFDERKATQLAGLLLKLREQEGRMHYMKLIKLLYLIDREALMRWGWSLTGDQYVSMKHGQVLSTTYDLILDQLLGPKYWRAFISPPLGDKEVQLLKEPESNHLSKAEVDLVTEVYRKFGHWNRWDLADYTHGLPEYRQTEGPSLPVGYADVLLKAKRLSETETEELLEDHRALALLQSLD